MNTPERSMSLTRRKFMRTAALGATAASVLAPVPRWLRRALAQDTDYSNLIAIENVHVVTEVGEIAIDDINQFYWSTVPNVFNGIRSLFGWSPWVSGGARDAAQAEYDRLLIGHYNAVRAEREALWRDYPEYAIYNSQNAQQVVHKGLDLGLTITAILSLIHNIGAMCGAFGTSAVFIQYGAIPMFEQILGAMATGTLTMSVGVTSGGAILVTVGVAAVGILAGIGFLYFIIHYDIPEVVHALMPTMYGVTSVPPVSVQIVETPDVGGAVMALHGLANISIGDPVADAQRAAFHSNPYWWIEGYNTPGPWCYGDAFCMSWRTTWGSW
jgi:hypothetical protein